MAASCPAIPDPSDAEIHGVVVVPCGPCDRPPARDRLTGSQLADRDRRDIVGVLLRELPVERLVVLTVVADQQPPDGGELAREPVQVERLCCRPLRNHPSAVGPQSVSSSGPGG